MMAKRSLKRSEEAKRRREERRRSRRRQRKAWALQSLGGKCVNCGETDPKKLQFHHLDDRTKDPRYRGISDAAKWKWDLFTAEVAKCSLLCFPCHLEHHRKNGYTVLSNDQVDSLWEIDDGEGLDDEEFEELWEDIRKDIRRG